MIDQTAFFSLSYGLYIVGATDGERRAACVANTFQQVTSSPLQVSVALNKENATTDVILDSGRFTVSCLAQDATMELIGTFGFHCSTDLDKFASCETGVDAAGVPFVAEQCVARFSVRVVQAVNLGTHILLPDAPDAAPAAAAAAGEGDAEAPKPKYAWRCKVCGHIEYGDELPDDFTCPVCSVGPDMFERIELQGARTA